MAHDVLGKKEANTKLSAHPDIQGKIVCTSRHSRKNDDDHAKIKWCTEDLLKLCECL